MTALIRRNCNIMMATRTSQKWFQLQWTTGESIGRSVLRSTDVDIVFDDVMLVTRRKNASRRCVDQGDSLTTVQSTMSSRKMRRTRESTVPTTADSGGGPTSRLALPTNEVPSHLSGFDLYFQQGDVVTALNIFSSNTEDGSSSLASQYNSILLKELVNPDKAQDLTSWLQRMGEIEASILSSSSRKTPVFLSPRKMKRNEYVLAYNRALIHYGMGDLKNCIRMCSEKLFSAVFSGPPVSDELDLVTCHFAFLYFECLLSFGVGRNAGLDKVVESSLRDLDIPTPVPSLSKIVQWLETVQTEKEPYVKFLIPVYKSRLALSEFDPSAHMLRLDGHVRSARKDMKTAMDIFQNKLRPSFSTGAPFSASTSQINTETDSVASSINSGEDKGQFASEPHSSLAAPTSVVLQKLNQSALSLKAHLEQLKGNTKKSLILCSEASAATPSDEDSYQPSHFNNLALVYETNNGRHLALHALAKALQSQNSNDERFARHAELRTLSSAVCMDGTVRSDPSLAILYNAAICGLRARNYLSAYECMVTCILRSDVFRHRPACWLRLSEACLGIHADLLQRQSSTGNMFSAVEVDGYVSNVLSVLCRVVARNIYLIFRNFSYRSSAPCGIILDRKSFRHDFVDTTEVLVASLGSSEDTEQVKRNPLLRARASLQHALQHGDDLESDTLMSIRLSLCYVDLAYGLYQRVLVSAKDILETVKITFASSELEPECVRRLHRRQLATASMYAAEASCALGDLNGAAGFLSGEGADDSFDTLAANLSGITPEMTVASDAAKRRLAKAQIMIRSSLCSVASATGSASAVKDIKKVVSTIALDDRSATIQDRLSARRALIYSLLRENNHSSALSMLLL
jgi:tetratricopeptide (TPR) repeat protein